MLSSKKCTAILIFNDYWVLRSLKSADLWLDKAKSTGILAVLRAFLTQYKRKSAFLNLVGFASPMLKDKSVLDEIAEGDKLKLQREDNRFDSNAILIFTQDNKKLGYVPEKDNIIFARLMDAGKCLSAKIKTIKLKGNFHQIAIGIYLMDF